MAGGPWSQPKGQAYTGFNVNYMRYSSIFGTGSGSIALPRTITEVGIGAYVEYGITDRLTCILDLPFRIVMSGDTTGNYTYFPAGDTLDRGRIIGMNYMGVGLKYKFLDKRIKMAAQLMYEANTASVDNATGLRTGPNAHVIAPKISIGASFGNDKFYAFGETGPRFRFPNLNNENDSTAQYSHDLDYLAELGYSWNGKTYFALVVSGRANLTQGTYDNGSTTIIEMDSLGLPISSYTYESELRSSINPNRQSFIGYGIKFTQKIKNFAINLGVYSGMGRRVAGAPSLNLGFSYTFVPKKKGS